MVNTQLTKPEYFELTSFINKWKDKNKMLNILIENIYVVFDVPNPKLTQIKPWIYLAFKKVRLPADISHNMMLKSTDFLEHTITKSASDLLLKCIENSCPPYWVFGFGLLNNRNENKVRIGIADFKNIESIGRYLEKCHWGGNTSKMLIDLSFMEKFATNFVLSLKLGSKIENIIGIECNLRKINNYEKARKLLNSLILDFNYDKVRSEAILQWINPDNYNSNEQYRWLNHIKFNYQNDKIIGIKPYLYYELFTI